MTVHVITGWGVKLWLCTLLWVVVCNCDCACYYGLGCAIVTTRYYRLGCAIVTWKLLWVGVCNCDCGRYYGLWCAIVTVHVFVGCGVKFWLCTLLCVGVCNYDCACYWGLGVCKFHCACYWWLGCAIVTVHVIGGCGVQLWLCTILTLALYWGEWRTSFSGRLTPRILHKVRTVRF